jgi:hypothetical protein
LVRHTKAGRGAQGVDARFLITTTSSASSDFCGRAEWAVLFFYGNRSGFSAEGERSGKGVIVKIVERIPAYYDAQEVVEDLGRAYRWCPEQVVLECDACGMRSTFKRSKLIASLVNCECGARCSAEVREELLVERWTEDEYLHPWRYWHTQENMGIPV